LFSAVNFLKFFGHQRSGLDPVPDWSRIRIGIQQKFLDPDHWQQLTPEEEKKALCVVQVEQEFLALPEGDDPGDPGAAAGVLRHQGWNS
jgi:hypothetical protein